MYLIDFNKPVHVHFIGIGGISMSGLADILHSKGFTVSGSDTGVSDLTGQLAARGITVYAGQKAENITGDTELVVYTAAIRPDNEEYAAAAARGIPMLTRAELLGEIMANYGTSVGVAGTHGKTTTTSMLAEILIAGDCDPTVSVGGILPSIGGNLRLGHSDNFITEACEYTNSFLSFRPTMEIILNIGEDHLDFFKDIHDIRNSFSKYVSLLPEDGCLIINNDIDNVKDIYDAARCNVITVGSTPDACYYPEGISYDSEGCGIFRLMHNGCCLGTVHLSVPGLHNIYNSIAAFAAARVMNVSTEVILSALSGFHGTHRRFEKKGTVNGITVIDDYAHHPDEINATLECAARYPHNRLVVVFQPHTYTRTRAFLDDFAKSLSRADFVILADIYAARETDDLGISSGDICKLVNGYGTECIWEHDFNKMRSIILEKCGKDDLVITMGAGNITELGDALVSTR